MHWKNAKTQAESGKMSLFPKEECSFKVNGCKLKFCQHVQVTASNIIWPSRETHHQHHYRVSAFLIPYSRQDLWAFEVTDKLKLYSAREGLFYPGADPNFFQRTSKPGLNVLEHSSQKYPSQKAQRSKHGLFEDALSRARTSLRHGWGRNVMWAINKAAELHLLDSVSKMMSKF